jgi:arylsulfatase A-like enzyme
MICFFLLIGHANAKGKKASGERPNIVFILADDMRVDYLACMGMNEIVQTPNLDKLASKGVLFQNAFVTSTICTPSRTTILTGQFERKHGITFGSNSTMTEKAFSQTFPMLLKENGYYTGYVGKNHTPIGISDKGFGYKSKVMDESFDYWYAGHGHLTFYPKERHNIFINADADNQVDIIQEGVDNFFDSDSAFAKAKNYLKSIPEGKPFSLQVNFNVPHSNGTGSMELRDEDPELYRTTYRDRIEQMPQPPTYIAAADLVTPKIPKHVYNGEYIKSYDFVKTPEALRERQVRTCQTVTGIDNLVGKLIKELEKQGKAENTVIIFTSDHGLHHGEHGLGGKTLLYEESLRIPLIIYDPRVPDKEKQKIVDRICLTVDIAPTILDLAGIDTPDVMQGESLKPLIYGENVNWRNDFFSENMFVGQNYPRVEAVRSSDWKYIRYFSKDNDQDHILSLISPLLGEEPVYEELFNLKSDPFETTNVAAIPGNEEILKDFRTRCNLLLKDAKGDNNLPDTHIKGWENKTFRDKVEKEYKYLSRLK